MQVSIEQREKTIGMFKKTNLVEVLTSVQFNDEERAIIQKHKLGEAVVLKRVPHSEWASKMSAKEFEDMRKLCTLRVHHLGRDKPDVHLVDNPLQAQQYEQALTDALRDLKGYIEANGSPVEGKRTFEL